MRVRRLPYLIALAQLAALSLAIPITPNTDTTEISSLLPRSEFCSNAPLTPAGTIFSRRALTSSPLHEPLALRTRDSIIWCARGSQTYVVIQAGWQVISDNYLTLLDQAYDLAVKQIQAQGDGLLYPLPTGAIGTVFNLNLNGMQELTMTVRNANNHQTTWGVLGAACWALKDFVSARGAFQTIVFSIYDGVNQVATGTIG